MIAVVAMVGHLPAEVRGKKEAMQDLESTSAKESANELGMCIHSRCCHRRLCLERKHRVRTEMHESVTSSQRTTSFIHLVTHHPRTRERQALKPPAAGCQYTRALLVL